MIHTILTTDNKSLTLELPDDMVGKTIEVIAFEINSAYAVDNIINDVKIAEKASAINNALSKYRVDLSNFKFDRDEANNYE